MRIAVLGAGAMGCLFGGLLSKAGQDVVLVDVWPDHIEEINRNGLRLDSDSGTQHLDVRAGFIEQVPEPQDLIILFTKGMYSEQALRSAAGIIGEHTCLLTLQNGLGAVDIAKTVLPPDRIIHGITTYPSDLIGPGHVRTKGSGKIWFMSVDGQPSPMVDALETAFRGAGLDATATSNVEAMIWEKLAFNAALNSMTAVSGFTVGQLGICAHGRKMAEAIADEVIAVAQRKGIAADRARVASTLAMAFAEHRDHQPSMLQDRLNRRKTEVEFVNGAVVREAAELGMEVPTTRALHDLVRMLEENYLS